MHNLIQLNVLKTFAEFYWYGSIAIMQASVTGASVRGLKGCKTMNKDPDPKNPIEGKEERYFLKSWNSCQRNGNCLPVK